MSDPRADWDLVETISGMARITRLVHADGLWVGMGVGGFGNAYIATATSAEGPWTLYGDIGIYENYDLVYANGYWVAGGGGATSTDPTSSWTVNTSLPTPWYAAFVASDGTRWGAASEGLIYSTTNPSGSWTFEIDITPSGQSVTGSSHIAYLNGEWVVVVNTSPDGLCRVLTASAVDGPWTQQASFSDAPGDTLTPWNIVATDDGYYIHFYYTVWYAPTLDGTWTKINDQFDWVAYGNGDYVWVQADIAVSDTVGGTREDIDVINLAAPESGYIYCATYGDSVWVAAGLAPNSGDAAGVWVAGEAGGDGWGLLL